MISPASVTTVHLKKILCVHESRHPRRPARKKLDFNRRNRRTDATPYAARVSAASGREIGRRVGNSRRRVRAGAPGRPRSCPESSTFVPSGKTSAGAWPSPWGTQSRQRRATRRAGLPDALNDHSALPSR